MAVRVAVAMALWVSQRYSALQRILSIEEQKTFDLNEGCFARGRGLLLAWPDLALQQTITVNTLVTKPRFLCCFRKHRLWECGFVLDPERLNENRSSLCGKQTPRAGNLTAGGASSFS